MGVLVCLPMLLKWVKQRVPGRFSDGSGQTRFISALGVGPHQRVVTVDVGPDGKRVWLTLGVTGQSISCLHRIDIEASGKLDASQLSKAEMNAGVGFGPEPH